MVCEHASNTLPLGYSWSDYDVKYFQNEHWGSDLGAAMMAESIAKSLKTIFLKAKYSRLLIDVNRDPGSEGLFRKRGDGKEVELNKSLTYEEEKYRIEKYHLSFYQALRDLSEEIILSNVLCIHSFTSVYEGKKRDLQIGILADHTHLELAEKLNESFKSLGYISAINQPYDASKMIVANNTLARSRYPDQKTCLTLEFRNDLLTDPPDF